MKNKITIEPHDCKTLQEKLDCEFCLAVCCDCDDTRCKNYSFWRVFNHHQVGPND